MKIMISGSSQFAKEMFELEAKLKELGHEAVAPIGVEPHLEDGTFGNNLEENLKFCLENDIMRRNFNQLAGQDAVVVFNKEKKGISGYMGVSTLMETAIAYFLKKKVFIMFPLPSMHKERWAHEVTIMQPVILNGNLSKII